MITIVQVIQAALKVVNTCNHNGNITDVKLYAWNMHKYNNKKKKKKERKKIQFILMQLIMMMTIVINPFIVSIYFLYLNRIEMTRY